MADTDVVSYGPDVPTEAELRLCGDVHGKRVLDLGWAPARTRSRSPSKPPTSSPSMHLRASCGSHASSPTRPRYGSSGTRATPPTSRSCAPTRSTSRSRAGLLGEVDDVDRLLRQVQRVLRPGSPFVFSFDHPVALALGRDVVAPGALPLGTTGVAPFLLRDDAGRARSRRRKDPRVARTIAEVFSALHRAGLRIDALLEPEPVRSADPGPQVPPRHHLARPQRGRLTDPRSRAQSPSRVVRLVLGHRPSSSRSSSRKSSASPTIGPGGTPRNFMTWSAVEGRPDLRELLLLAAARRSAASSSSMRRPSAAALRSLRVVQSQRVSSLSSSSNGRRRRARSGARRCRSSPSGTCGNAGAARRACVDVLDDVVRVAQREQPFARHAARRPLRGGGTSRRCGP